MTNFYKFNLETHTDKRGTLVPLVDTNIIPFDVKRIYYILGTKNDQSRGKLAHKSLEQVLVCVNGKCQVLLDDGKEQNIITLDNYNTALYISKGLWREIFNFSSDCILFSLNSESHSEYEVIRDYDEFLVFSNCQES